jgi:glycosyltransferase involved in cell wall biosynthesis
VRIAQVAPLHESVPPARYGGTERVVSYLTEELVAMGHDVTLFASGDSKTAARLVPACPRALRLAGAADPLAHHVRMIEQVAAAYDTFDVVHFHVDYLHFPVSRRQATPSVTTLHGRLDRDDLVPLYREFDDQPLVSISDAQRRPLAFANWVRTVHHGMPIDDFTPSPTPGRYLAFVGRVSPLKRVDRAIDIAVRAGIELRIAAKVDPADQAYFDEEVRPRLDHPGIVFLGEVDERARDALLDDALAMVFPIDWPEPFGLAMIESMARGTPVIAWRRGSVPEVVDEGVTGWVVESIDEAVAAIGRTAAIDRRACRRRYEQRFSARRMAEDYLEVYAEIGAGVTRRRR